MKQIYRINLNIYANESRGNVAVCVRLWVCRVEGRTWYTSHRGRLWIAAAAKTPTPQEIAEVEAMYRQVYKKGTQGCECLWK